MTPARSALSGTSAPIADKRHAVTKISLVLADVDGTLVTPGKVLTPRAAAAVNAIHDAGIAFAITSGRPPRGMAMLVEPLALRSPIAGFNGGAFVSPDLTIIEQHVLPPDVAARASTSSFATVWMPGFTVIGTGYSGTPARPMWRGNNRPSSLPRPSSKPSRGFKATL